MASASSLTITRQKQTNQYFEEDLGKGILPLQMMRIPAGSFVMGSPADELERQDNEGPQHKVTLGEFYMGRYPVTQAQWRAVAAMPQVEIELDPDPSNFKGDLHPVERVTWHEAMEFCARLSQQTQRAYSLPGEAQWEYACRAGTTTTFNFGDTITKDLANYRGDGSLGRDAYYYSGAAGEFRNSTTPVDQFGIANHWGLCDMHGNVREWCLDLSHTSYEGAPTDGSAWIANSSKQMYEQRGGSWFNDPRACRSARRNVNVPSDRHFNNGLRVICELPRTLSPSILLPVVL